MMLKGFRIKSLVAIASVLLTYGASASAAHSLDTVTEFTAHLNYYYPSLNLTITGPSATAQDVNDILLDLESLEDELHGETKLEPNSLKKISCTKPSCG